MPSPEPTLNGPDPALSRALGARYTLQREVGRGGTGLVYLAIDHKHDRPVAVKVLRSEVAADVESARFLREIGVVARLQHPHIVPIYDSGDAESLLYLVMPFVDGESLRERLEREHQLSLAETLRLGREVAEALSFAHSRNVLHRDMKPENVLLFRGHALVVDFGIAQALTHEGGHAVAADHESDEGTSPGTPRYMAPEQVFGDAPLDERADVYGLATMLYELLVGRTPFDGLMTVAMLSRKASHAAPPPSDTLEPLPAHVEHALMRALEREREHRFASVAAFADAMLVDPTGRPAVRASGATTRKSIVVLPFENATGEPTNEYLSDGISEDLIHALSRVPSLRVVARTSAFSFKGRASDPRAVGAELGVDTVLTGTVRRVGERVRIMTDLTDAIDGFALWSERFDRELSDVFDVQDEIARAITETLRVRSPADAQRLVGTPTGSFRAYDAFLKGRFEWSQRTPASMQRALEHLQVAAADDPLFTLAHTGLADCFLTLAIYDVVEPSEAMPKALRAAEAALRTNAASAEGLTARASVRALYDFNWRGAEGDYLAALAEHEHGSVTHQWYAMHLLCPRGRFVEAHAHLARARELDPLAPAIASSAGILRLYEGDPEQAERELDLVIAQHPAFGLAHLFQGLALVARGMAGAALGPLERARLLSGNNAESRSAMGVAQAMAGMEEAARETLTSLEGDAKARYISPLLIAQVRIALGDHARALDDMERAMAVRAAGLAYLAVRPWFDSLRGHPRFQAIVRAIEA